MSHTTMLSRAEVEAMGPPVPEEISELGVGEGFLCELALKHVAMLPEPTTSAIAERLHLPRSLTEEILQKLYREKLIEVRLQTTLGSTRYAMLDHGWDRLVRLLAVCGYSGAAPVSLNDYAHMMRLQSIPSHPASMDTVRRAFHDLILPDSLLQTLGCVINSRRSLFLTGLPGTGKTAVAERINNALPGAIWIPYAVEIDGQIIRVFDSHCHRIASPEVTPFEYDRRWVLIDRPLVVVGGELTLENADLTWSEAAKFYEAPFQMKSNGGTLVIDDFGRQRVAPQDLLNRWIVPLERRVDYLALHTGKKIEVPFEQLVVFSTNLDEKDLADQAFLRRMGYRARVEPPTPRAYIEIFKRQAYNRGIQCDEDALDHVLNKYRIEHRQMKGCEPRDLLDRITDICLFDGHSLALTPEVVDVAWRNYFGTSHTFAAVATQETMIERTLADPLEL
ncbi:MAG: ATPase [Pyrinomonadaceae bacterium]